MDRALSGNAPTILVPVHPTEFAPIERRLFAKAEGAAIVPFKPSREVPGAVLLLYDRPDPGLSRSDLEFLSTLAQQIGIALENARLYQLAIEDPATGLYVHQHFLARLREETDRAPVSSRPLSVVLVSLAAL